jgi:hypothetical protein
MALPTSRSTTKSDFLKQLRKAPTATTATGKLIIALDATASREPTWDRACRIQGEMFEATAALGGLEIQLVFYRGLNECQASKWLRTPKELYDVMAKVRCVTGGTQIERVLDHVISETKTKRIGALILVGDAFEEETRTDKIHVAAKMLGGLGVPVFCFHEGDDQAAAQAFQQIATLSGGAYATFNLASAEHLKELLGAVAAYAAGGYEALENYGAKRGGAVLQIAHQMRERP